MLKRQLGKTVRKGIGVKEMPIYEYHCEQCDIIQEELVLGKEKPVICKKCGKEMKRIMSRSSFHLKGTGWYATDYANKGKATPKKKAVDTKLKKEN